MANPMYEWAARLSDKNLIQLTESLHSILASRGISPIEVDIKSLEGLDVLRRHSGRLVTILEAVELLAVAAETNNEDAMYQGGLDIVGSGTVTQLSALVQEVNPILMGIYAAAYNAAHTDEKGDT